MTYDPRQYYGPYVPPNPATSPYFGYATGYDPQSQLRAPGRWAGLIMIVAGSLMLLFGGCGAMAFSFFLNPPALTGPQAAEFMQRRAEALAQFKAGGINPHTAVTSMWVVLVIGLAMLVLGIPVRRSSRWALRIAVVFVGVLVALQGISFIQLLRALLATGQAQLMVMLVFAAVPLATFITIEVLLRQALRNCKSLGDAQLTYQQQLWQYQQQMYAQGYWPPPSQPPQ